MLMAIQFAYGTVTNILKLLGKFYQVILLGKSLKLLTTKRVTSGMTQARTNGLRPNTLIKAIIQQMNPKTLQLQLAVKQKTVQFLMLAMQKLRIILIILQLQILITQLLHLIQRLEQKRGLPVVNLVAHTVHKMASTLVNISFLLHTLMETIQLLTKSVLLTTMLLIATAHGQLLNNSGKLMAGTDQLVSLKTEYLKK